MAVLPAHLACEHNALHTWQDFRLACIACTACPAVLTALNGADRRLQALRASLAATANLVDSGRQLAAVAAAWGGFVSAYDANQVGRAFARAGAGMGCACCRGIAVFGGMHGEGRIGCCNIIIRVKGWRMMD